MFERELVLKVSPHRPRRFGITLRHQGGKPRLVIDGDDSRGIHVQRQIAAALLMPRPRRADEGMAEGLPVLRRDKYAIENLNLIEVNLSGNDKFEVLPERLESKNLSEEWNTNFSRRFSRVSALWARRDGFPKSISKALERHQELVLSNLDMPIGQEIEDTVVSLQQAVAQHVSPLGIDYEEDMDPLDALDKVPQHLAVALLAKPLVIITGQSGTGKSKSAIELASAFDYGASLSTSLEASQLSPATCMAFVSVESDWTDQRDLLGYPNPFGPRRVTSTTEGSDRYETHQTYEITEVLKLILRAMHPDYRNQPHFLVLDEMNLSHVERYFSSFLSLMEAERSSSEAERFELVNKDNLALISQVLEQRRSDPMELESAKALLAEHSGLPFPPNLFVVGTVNIDETTYMFSPKVLDRAFVMELNSVEPNTYFEKETPSDSDTLSGDHTLMLFQKNIDSRRMGSVENKSPADVLDEAAAVSGLTTEEAADMKKEVKAVLHGLYKLLEPVGFGFGYRVVNEVVRYVLVSLEAQRIGSGGSGSSSVDWRTALDNAVLMKVLPKIHGNRRQLGDSLRAISAFLVGETAPEASYSLGTAPEVNIEESERIGFELTHSSAKVDQLAQGLRAMGYATFVS